jgi:hypothetical protein
MARAVSTGFVLLVLMAVIAGCADMATAPVMSAQQECERSGGMWRTSTNFCERASGGGGY